MVSGVDSGIGAVDNDAHSQRRRGGLGFFFWTFGEFSGPLVLMAFLSSFIRDNVFDLCVRSL